MSDTIKTPILINEDRYSRLEAISWWDQSLLQKAHILVVGSGALGNEIIKNLALLGVRHLVIVDNDRIEKSNLTRSVLFRESDEGLFKAECAARSMKEICPEAKPTALNANVVSDVGLGYFRWSQVIIGALDNREARVFVNSACSMLGRTWFDGGIEVLHGIVRGFSPPETACYECTMSQADWNQINQRRSCSLLARKLVSVSGTPTTPTTAAVIGGIQTQEVVKLLHGLSFMNGKGYFFDGLAHDSYTINYQIKSDCGCHESALDVLANEDVTSNTPLRVLSERAEQRLGGLDSIDLGRELVRRLKCPECGREEEVWKSVESITAEQAVCKSCGAESVPVFLHSLKPDSMLLNRSPRQLGLPKWDIIWAHYGNSSIGLEISGDNPFYEDGKNNS
ncbi:ThiF family adenylyltransferase [Thermodesulfobacteriota bacterium]